MLMLDIDNFKTINDTYGHSVGDRVLLAFAKKCKQFVRENDFLARYGGEEFAIVLPGSSLRNAAKRARQICKSIAAARYAIQDTGSGDVLKVTTSIGVSVKRKKDTAASLIDRADKALYMAKQSGKNRVVTEKKIQLPSV